MKVVPGFRFGPFAAIIYFLFASSTAFGQRDKFEEGYIITLQGDSVYGRIAIQEAALSAKTCKFKGQANEIKTFSPTDIRAYGVGVKKRYVAYTIKSGDAVENVFLSCLVKGKISLYYFQERYFVDSGNGAQELITSKTNVTRDGKVFSQELPVYKGVLQAAMNDCSTIHENLKTASLKKNDLTKLFESYYKCVGQPATTYESGAGKIKVDIGIALSGQSTGFDIKSGDNPTYIYLDNNEPMTHFTLAPTFIAEFYAPEGKGRFRVRTGLSYFAGNYHYYDQGSPGALDHSITIDMARIELPIMLKYYPFKKTGIYLAAGVGFNVSVKWEDTSLTIVPPITILSETSDLKNNSFFTNPMAGIGFDFPIGNRKLFIEGIIGQSKSVLSPSGNPTSKFNSLTFTTGIIF